MAVHLQLPDVSAEGAVRLEAVGDYLAKRRRAEAAQRAPGRFREVSEAAVAAVALGAEADVSTAVRMAQNEA